MTNHIYHNSQISNLKDGFYHLKKDTEALMSFLSEVKNSSMEFSSYEDKLNYLIDNNFYENFYNLYSKDEIFDINNLIKKENFQFKSYMSAKKFYQDYALKTNDQKTYLETYEDRITAVSLFLGNGNFNKAKTIANSLIKQYYQPATPTFLNSGKKRRGELISCFLLEMDDSLNSISFNLSTVMYLSKIGGGVAINLSNLRARGENIKGINNASKGVVPVLKLLEDAFNYADQMGQRKGAGAAYLNIFHYDIEEFLDTKKINADEKSRLQTLSLGVLVPDKFFEIAKQDKPLYVFAPQSVYNAFGISLDEMDMAEYYDKLVADETVIKKELNARDLLTNIARTQFESGYPYMIYIDHANKANPLKQIGKIKMSNLCTEIFQIQQKSQITDYHQEDVLGHDICCVLGSLNIVNIMEDAAIKEAVYSGMEALTAVTDLSNIQNAPTIEKANKNFRSVGLGAMNLHGFLSKNEIEYESTEAIDFVSALFMAINYYSIEKSMLIAKERQTTFFGFEESEYKNGNYFKKYLEEDFSPKTDKVKSLFKNIKIPTQEDWQNLMLAVQEHGLFHAYRLAIAPTQSISYVQNSTQSILPIVDQIETRTYSNSTTYYPMPYLNKENSVFFKSAYKMDMMKVIDLISAAQVHIDQGISTIMYVDSETSTKDLIKLYLYAHKKGLKSLYYTRTKNLSIEECIACAI